MNNENYTCDWFISFFEAIPEDRWCLYNLLSTSGRSCALGHCGARVGSGAITKHTPMSAELNRLFNVHLGDPPELFNDCVYGNYQQPTPKARILQALRDIKAKQEAEQLTNLQQCGVEGHAGPNSTSDHPSELPGLSEPVLSEASRNQARPLLQLTPPPVREPVGCVHMWLETTQTCLYCGSSKPIYQPAPCAGG